ncbi:MAG: short-chain dehydrogenase [Thermonema sp.]|uniref:SDR family oxidoreductase n=1 Tax=Thermonema sp. TaxID=2231181 RepID=UPI0021DE7280|nr:SDR family oxidoreductase [Thermonema sp.]GIV38990.1 MAG: short-chain dehydrogenase [Thermonema sp.]
MKSIFITGATGGIGAATARLFSQEGWFVGLFDLHEEALQRLSASLPGPSCYAVMDVRKEEEVRKAMVLFGEQTQKQMHVLLNNAGLLEMGFFDELPLEKQKRLVDVNLWGVMNVTYHALPLLKNTEGACVVNMSSASAIYGTPEVAVYSASKHAVRALSEALELEFERHGIHVCAMMPLIVRTPMVTDAPYRAWSFGQFGYDLEAEDVALAIWKAVHHPRTHYKIPFKLRFLVWIYDHFPFLRKWLMRRLTLAPEIRKQKKTSNKILKI